MILTAPRRAAPAGAGRTASGSVVVPDARARIARASRIYVEGRHDAELIAQVWGEDLRIEGVVVEHLGGVDDLVGIVAEFRPESGPSPRGTGRPPGRGLQGDADRRRGAPRARVARHTGRRSPLCRHLAGGEAAAARPGGLAESAAPHRSGSVARVRRSVCRTRTRPTSPRLGGASVRGCATGTTWSRR